MGFYRINNVLADMWLNYVIPTLAYQINTCFNILNRFHRLCI